MRLPALAGYGFPFLLGRAFIEALIGISHGFLVFEDFPSFWEGLSLRLLTPVLRRRLSVNFPSFWEGLSLRQSELEAPVR